MLAPSDILHLFTFQCSAGVVAAASSSGHTCDGDMTSSQTSCLRTVSETVAEQGTVAV